MFQTLCNGREGGKRGKKTALKREEREGERRENKRRREGLHVNKDIPTPEILVLRNL